MLMMSYFASLPQNFGGNDEPIEIPPVEAELSDLALFAIAGTFVVSVLCLVFSGMALWQAIALRARLEQGKQS